MQKTFATKKVPLAQNSTFYFRLGEGAAESIWLDSPDFCYPRAGGPTLQIFAALDSGTPHSRE